MNLIEKLGGYESAYKFHLDRVNSHKTFIYDGLDKELLNYRRENSIFEVGDLVILPNRLYLDALQKITFINKVHGLYQYTDGCCGYGQNIRHATDEEIKAGHRLDSVQY